MWIKKFNKTFILHVNEEENVKLNLENYIRAVFENYISIFNEREPETNYRLMSIEPDQLLHFLLPSNNSLLGPFKLINDHLKQDYILFLEKFLEYYSNLDKYIISSQHFTENERINILADYNSYVANIFESKLNEINEDKFSVKIIPYTGFKAHLVTSQFNYSKDIKTIKIDYSVVKNIYLNTPFIVNSFANTRSGLFSESKEKFNTDRLNQNDYIFLVIKVGKLLMYVYCHYKYIHHAITIFNLFTIASKNEIQTQQPHGILYFGIPESEFNAKYFYDKKNERYIGYISDSNKNDYFGYMKKMLLTLFNLHQINQKNLPIHGAMVKIKLIDNQEKNIIILGDSGAGKSETLEALRLIGSKMIKKMEILFDDMGSIELIDNKCYATGTEIGAFVRVDDLDNAYVYDHFNDSILINPSKINARLVNRVTTYDTITTPTKIDYFLYANNYEQRDDKIKIFENLEDAILVFSKGARIAKGTTSELGLVENFFANPFGPVQERRKTEGLINLFFSMMNKEKTVIGELYTQLGIKGYEHEGPRAAADYLLRLILEKI